MMEKTSITSLMSAFGRAYHAENSANPVFADTAAKELMTEEEYRNVGSYLLSGIDFLAPDRKGTFASEKQALTYLVNTQIAPTPVARARFCENSLMTALRSGTEQYVILGAGMDTFAYRYANLLKRLAVFEVDHPLTQADKLMRVKRAEFRIPENLHFVPVDFATDSLGDSLLKSGFDAKKKTFFSWLGVTYYLTAEQIENTLREISLLSAEGSSLVFDFADPYLFRASERRVQNMIAMAHAGGEPMKSCFSEWDLEKILIRYGFLIYELLEPKDIQKTYFEGQDESLTAFEHICYLNAVKKA